MPALTGSKTRDAHRVPPTAAAAPAGYRMTPGIGPLVRTDVVDVYVFRRVPARRGVAVRKRADGSPTKRGAARVEFLQVLRSSEPLALTWHPVMGHIEAGETAAECAVREIEEELGISVSLRTDARTRSPAASAKDSGRVGLAAVEGFWALEQVHPFYIAAINMIVMSPRFALEVNADWTPRLNEEHGEFRWIDASRAENAFMWPGQAAACDEVMKYIVNPRSLARERLRIEVC